MTFKPIAEDPNLEFKHNLATSQASVVEIQRRPTKTLKIPSPVETNPASNQGLEIKPGKLPEEARNLRIPNNKQTLANQEVMANSKATNRSPNNLDRDNNPGRDKDKVSNPDKDRDKVQEAKLHNLLATPKEEAGKVAAEAAKASRQALTIFYANSLKAKMELANPLSPDVGSVNGRNAYALSKNL